jgi:hypothetical protein
MLPTRTEIWQWNGKREQFELKGTVPYKQRYAEISKLLEAEEQ